MSKFLVCLNGDEISTRAFDQSFKLFQSLDIVNLLCVLNLQDYVLTASQQEMLEKRKKQEILDHSVDYSTFVKANSQMIDKAREVLEPFEKRLESGNINFKSHIAVNVSPVEEMLLMAEELEADYLIVGYKNKGLLGSLLQSSASEAVLKGAKCPVIIVK